MAKKPVMIKPKKIDKTFEERISRNNPQDQIEIGRIVEDATKGDFGTVLRLIINGIIATELNNSKSLKVSEQVSSDRVLGRIESLNDLQERLDLCVSIKNQLMEELKKESRVDS